MSLSETTESTKKDYFVFSGEHDYYGRVCENYGKKCEECKWDGTNRCRDGTVRG